MTKDFENWNKLKQKLDERAKPPFFNEGQIWWCSVGVNIGYEIYGKSNIFTRPVLILKKYSRFTFLAIPMSSKRKDRADYLPIDFKDYQGSFILNQARTLDSRRLQGKMGELSKKKLANIQLAFFEYNKP